MSLPCGFVHSVRVEATRGYTAQRHGDGAAGCDWTHGHARRPQTNSSTCWRTGRRTSLLIAQQLLPISAGAFMGLVGVIEFTVGITIPSPFGRASARASRARGSSSSRRSISSSEAASTSPCVMLCSRSPRSLSRRFEEARVTSTVQVADALRPRRSVTA